jgi:hypothetical protein
MPKPPSQAGCSWVEECVEECDGPSLFVEEEGVRATFQNPRKERLRKVHYDGCYAPTGAQQADYILGLVNVIDVVVELKKTDTNIRGAADQIESTIHSWRTDQKRAPRIAALIVYGRIEGPKRLPGRIPRAKAVISGVVARFLKRGTLLLIEETGRRQYNFRDFME